MRTNDSFGIIIIKWLVTILSIAITLPALFDTEARMVFIITACVFIFSKLVDNIEGANRSQVFYKTITYVIGSVIGVVAFGLCFYYFAAIFNETKFVPSVSNESTEKISMETDNNQLSANTETDNSYSIINMSRYPLFSGESLYVILFFVLMFYLLEETVLGGFELCKYLNTTRKLSLKRNRKQKIVNIDLI